MIEILRNLIGEPPPGCASIEYLFCFLLVLGGLYIVYQFFVFLFKLFG